MQELMCDSERGGCAEKGEGGEQHAEGHDRNETGQDD